MRKTAALFCLLLGGCSNAPVADFLDWVKPGKLSPDPKVLPTGGVCQPPLPILNAPVVPIPATGPVVAPPPGGVIPPPIPFPSTGSPPAVPSIPVPSSPPPPMRPPGF